MFLSLTGRALLRLHNSHTMNKSTYKVEKMDCPAEEQLIRMKLTGSPAIAQLQFDLPGRQLTVFHTGDTAPITQTLDGLNFGSTLLYTTPSEAAELLDEVPRDQRLLWAVLAINAFFFLLEIVTGWLARSMGLAADSFDMLADALIYALALYAVGRAVATQHRVARAAGYLQLALALGGLAETVRRFLSPEPAPNVGLMLGIAFLALLGNWATLRLLQQASAGQVHIKASQIFTSNDVVVNLGVMLAAGLVYFTHSPLPDLIIGLIVFGIVGRGAWQIFALAKPAT